MNLNISKTIREAFNVVYINKLLKEDSEYWANNMSPDELSKAEKEYYLFVAGKSNLMWGDLKANIQNYIIEKASEEYRQTKNKKIHNAIMTFYYPSEGSKLFNYIREDSFFKKKVLPLLIKRFKDNWNIVLPDILNNAWTHSIADLNKFEKIVNTYVNAYREDGISSFFISGMEIELFNLATQSDAKKRGGSVDIQTLDSLDFDSKSDIKNDSSMDSDQEVYQKLDEMITEFGNKVAGYFKSINKGKLEKLAKEFFVNRKTYAEIANDNRTEFEGKSPGDLSIIMIRQVVEPKDIKNIASSIGGKYGFPSSWLENILKTKNISSISDILKVKDRPYTAPKERDKLVYEKKKPSI